jgi:hypothetical protein
MEVVWLCSAKTLEYGIWGEGRYGGWTWRFRGRQPDDVKDVSERVIEIHVRVIENAGEFVTIATA